MTRASKMMILTVVLALGLWGCARGPANRAGNERVRTLESRNAKLEQDYRSAAAARDEARKQAQALEEENATLQKELSARASLVKENEDLRQQLKTALAQRAELQAQAQQLTKERDEARQLVGTRTSERDSWQGRHDRFRQGLQSLLHQDDPQAASPVPPMPIINGNESEPTPPITSTTTAGQS